MGFDLNIRNSALIFMAAIMGGFLIGFVGIGGVVFIILILENLKLNIKSLMASIVLMVCCTTFIGIYTYIYIQL